MNVRFPIGFLCENIFSQNITVNPSQSLCHESVCNSTPHFSPLDKLRQFSSVESIVRNRHIWGQIWVNESRVIWIMKILWNVTCYNNGVTDFNSILDLINIIDKPSKVTCYKLFSKLWTDKRCYYNKKVFSST